MAKNIFFYLIYRKYPYMVARILGDSVRIEAKLMPKVWMSISFDLDIFENKYFALLFYDYVSLDFLNKQKIIFSGWIPLRNFKNLVKPYCMISQLDW